MSHWIMEGAIKTIKGTPYPIAKRNAEDEVVWKNEDKGIPEVVDATVQDIIELVIFRQPPATITRQDSIHAGRLYNQVWESGRRGKGYYEVEDAEWDWLRKKMQDDKVGPVIFGIQLTSVENCLDALEKEGAGMKKADIESASKSRNGQVEAGAVPKPAKVSKVG